MYIFLSRRCSVIGRFVCLGLAVMVLSGCIIEVPRHHRSSYGYNR